MTTVLIVVALVAWAANFGFMVWRHWWGRPRREKAETKAAVEEHGRAERVVKCDWCDAPATVHLVETFDDEDEREFGGGSTAMRADYCDAHADEVGVDR